jgi:N-methylhydantoinase A
VGAAADVALVRARIAERIGAPLGLSADAAAAGILAVANAAMADAIRFMSVEKGFDPREFAIFAFGGAGPLHASALARELGVPRIMVPLYPGITSALGCVLADVRHDYGRTVNRPLRELDGQWVDEVLAAQGREGRALIEREAVNVSAVVSLHEADFLYQGQTHVMRMPVASPGFDPALVLPQFEALYRERFDVDLSEMRPILAALRTTVIGRRERIEGFGLAPPDGALATNVHGPESRAVWFGGQWLHTPVLARHGLRAGDAIPGPAIVEQLDTTTVIEPGDTAKVDAAGNLIITVGQ